MAQVLAFVDDLFFQAKLLETGKQLGIEICVCTSPDALAEESARSAPSLVVVDLNSRADALEAIATMHRIAPEVPLLGFLSHVQVYLAEQAREAGCGEVMPRSKFTRQLATILSRAKSEE